MTKSESALAKVQDLYVIQVELWNVLDSRELSADQVAQAKERLRQFKSLLSQADWRLMGGEDVLQALQDVQSQVSAKLSKKKSVVKNAKRGSLSGGKPVRRAAAAKPLKKAAAKKKPKAAAKKKVVKKVSAKKRK